MAAGVSVFAMGLALYLVQVHTTLFGITAQQSAQVVQADPGIVIVGESDDPTRARVDAYRSAADAQGNMQRMVIDDVKIGTGAVVEKGDVVSVHYAGTLQNGQEFDNSRKRGAPFEFKVGGGQVIKGWDEGLVGMKVGGQRVLVIPSDMAYGDQGIGPIPGGATLVFTIELLEVK
ncbi:FKBP-type peptidyl-prolyl cis-trans isomerase [Candidatus Kaiserbacteria bacterium]|nr:FKBP-type peptidyl-prolyl cis-trans isomerase [Candidatus Kaiserbacteria bacterium]